MTSFSRQFSVDDENKKGLKNLSLPVGLVWLAFSGVAKERLCCFPPLRLALTVAKWLLYKVCVCVSVSRDTHANLHALLSSAPLFRHILINKFNRDKKKPRQLNSAGYEINFYFSRKSVTVGYGLRNGPVALKRSLCLKQKVTTVRRIDQNTFGSQKLGNMHPFHQN